MYYSVVLGEEFVKKYSDDFDENFDSFFSIPFVTLNCRSIDYSRSYFTVVGDTKLYLLFLFKSIVWISSWSFKFNLKYFTTSSTMDGSLQGQSARLLPV